MVARREVVPLGSAARAGDSGGLFAAKFARPHFPPSVVRRPRLIDRLDEGAQGEVTLITAGPGSGKTLLVAVWVETGQVPGPVAWLSLDGYDNHPAAFWSYLLGALRNTGAVPDDSPLAQMRPGPRVDETFVRRIARAVAELPHPIVLVLEDLHEIDNPQVLQSLAFLLHHPVRQLRLFVTTRDDRAVPLHRPRVRNRLVEVRAEELSFTSDEAADLLAGHNVRLAPADLRTVLDRTEGWAAGLRLAAMVLSARHPKVGLDAFTGTERTVAAYLAREVLAGLPPSVRRFLLLTSVADRVCGELADALTGETDGHRTLERLAGENSLVIRLGQQRPWYRYHRLLGDLLRHQLRLEMPELINDLDLKAAHWFAREGAVLYAVSHAVAAQDWSLVGRLVITMAAARILSVDRRPLMDLLAQVPAQHLSATAGLELVAAVLAFDRKDYAAIPARVARARALLCQEEAELRRPTEIVARALESSVARVRGDVVGLVETESAALELLAEVSPAQFPSALQYRAIALNNAGVGLFWMGRSGPAETQLRSGMVLAESSGVELTQLNAVSHLALLEAERGNLHEANGYVQDALKLGEKRGWLSVLQIVPAFLALAITSLEWNALGDADAAFTSGLAAQRSDPEPVQYTALRVAEARILLARGQVDAARLAAERTGWQTGAGHLPPLLAQWLAVAGAEIELSAGHPDAALRLIGRFQQGVGLSARMLTCVARAHLALGDPRAAETVLTPLHTSAPDLRSAVEAWLVTALVQDALRQNKRSVDAFARAVALAEPQSMRGPFVGVGQSRTTGLLEQYQWLNPERSPLVASLLLDFSAPHRTPASGPETEELTDRELDVLRYLPTMLRNQDIAAQMYVSVNTVKAHLRALYRKLGVTHRREAVDRAREMGLL
jgi:LuxR family transcriptional regulator, maltose regulon positive regulatory protein